MTDRVAYVVRFYDAKMSRKGRGVQVRQFFDRETAELFASTHRLYAKPCRVEELKIRADEVARVS